MANDVKMGVGFIIPAAGVVGFFISLLLGKFLVSIIISIVGILAWFLYMMIMDSGIPPGGELFSSGGGSSDYNLKPNMFKRRFPGWSLNLVKSILITFSGNTSSIILAHSNKHTPFSGNKNVSPPIFKKSATPFKR